MGKDKMALTMEARPLLVLIVVQGDGRSANFVPVLGLYKEVESCVHGFHVYGAL